MGAKRRRYTAAFKAKAALEALRERRTVRRLGVHPGQITQWKRVAVDGLADLFTRPNKRTETAQENLTARLYQEIGQLKVELDWLKKNLGASVEGLRLMVEPEHPKISISRQCELLGLSRSSYYYEPRSESPENLALMRLIDEVYTAMPFLGSRKMTAWLREKHHQTVNRKRVQRLMRLMGLEVIYPKPKLSKRNSEHRVYPYLLGGVTPARPNHIWSTDITYIRLVGGFLYLVAIMDWYSRAVLSWELSNTLEVGFCLAALERALSEFGVPEIFNSDQGSQFTSPRFTEPLLDHAVQISMDGRGRALDNVYIERLWRTVKWEDIYLKDYVDGGDTYAGLEAYFSFYNYERPHQALQYRTPAAVYVGPGLTMVTCENRG